jgi:hypothetical protein
VKTQRHTQRKRRKRKLTTEQLAARYRIPIAIPLKDWARVRSVSYATARRLIASGRLRVTELSPRRLGVTTTDDAAYLKSCRRAS